VSSRQRSCKRASTSDRPASDHPRVPLASCRFATGTINYPGHPRAIHELGHARLEDSETHEIYVVLKAEVYDQIRSLIDFDVRDAYAMAMRVFGADGWDDPVMDEYNALDAHHI